MSNLLKEAIVDAKALKDAALKNAEATIIQKYSQEVKQTIDHLLEQDEMGLEMGGDLTGGEMGDPGMDTAMPEPGADPMAADAGVDPMAADPMAAGEPPEEVTDDDIPFAATDGLSQAVGVNNDDFPSEDDTVEFNVDLGALNEVIENLTHELEEEEEVEINEEDLFEEDEDDDQDDLYEEEKDEPGYEKPLEDIDLEEMLQREVMKYLDEADDAGISAAAQEDADVKAMSGLENPKGPKDDDDENVDAAEMATEEVEIPQDLVDEIMEKLTVDMGASLSGWAGRSADSMKYEMEREMAHRRSTDVAEEMKDLKKAYEELVFESNQLNKQNKQQQTVVKELREGMQEVNLSNARLLYTNRVLRNTSLNERQKTKIVEAISNAGSVMEARTIQTTLTESSVAAKPSKRPQTLNEAIARNSSVIRASRSEKPQTDTFSDRMKQLAGIK
tara:strand:+ start:1066 stop:2403 length:1338 start_codon:yes stop_codon:yes gene_type:complete